MKLSKIKILKFGFGIEDFGGHAVLIREIPAVLDCKNFVEIFQKNLPKQGS